MTEWFVGRQILVETVVSAREFVEIFARVDFGIEVFGEEAGESDAFSGGAHYVVVVFGGSVDGDGRVFERERVDGTAWKLGS